MKGSALIGKVLIGLLLTGAVLSVAIFFMYHSIREVSVAVDEAGNPNRRLEEWKTAVNILYDAENETQDWRISKKQSSLDAFDSLRTESAIHIARLKSLNHDSARGLKLCDSLQILSEDRFDLLGEWLSFSMGSNEEQNVLNDILGKMAEREKEVTKKKKEIAASEVQQAQAEPVKERTFWQRLAHRNDPVPEVKNDSVKADTLVPYLSTNEIKAAIASGQLKIESKSDSLLGVESWLLKSDQKILAGIHNISEEYEKLCSEETSEKLKTVSEAAAAGTRSVTWWTIAAAICIILFSVFYIGRDIIRSRKLQLQLQQAKENAEKLAKTKEEFVANISHEIRTPLNVISGFSANLLKENTDEKTKTYLEGINRSSEFLVALVNDVLDFSKMSSGKLQLENIPFRLKDVCSDLENAFGVKAKEQGLKFTITVAPSLPEFLVGDPVRFRQILFNLVSNAIKFTEKGFISVDFKSENEKLIIKVSDSGIGIPKDKMETIFEEFEQADASITRKYGGTGLGLSITKILLREMKGDIKTESEPGKGTSFTILLPLVKGEKPQTQKAGPVGKKFLEGKTILLCDDEPMNRVLASHMISAHGAKIIESNSGEETLELLKKEKPDLLLLDLQMPGMSGEETIRAIREKEKQNETPQLKIIAVSGKYREQITAIEKLVDGYLQKPYKEADIIKEIGNVIEPKNS